MSRQPQRDVSNDAAVPAHNARHTADSFREDRIALVRHRTRTFLAFLEFLLGFAYFGALPVTNLQRELVQRGSDDGQGAEVFRVGISLNDLRRDGRWF